MSDEKEVIATGKAYYKGALVREGDIVIVPVGFTASWAVDSKDYTRKPKPAPEEPMGFSQAGRKNPLPPKTAKVEAKTAGNVNDTPL